MDAKAIDFRKLYLKEKKRILLQRKKEKEVEEDTKVDRSALDRAFLEDCSLLQHYSQLKSFSSSLEINPLCRKTNMVDNSGVYYKARYLENLDFQKELIGWLQQLPINHETNNQSHALGRWTALPHAKRRVAMFDARRQTIPDNLREIVSKVGELFDEKEPPNHLLINEYESYQGIIPHTDGPAYAARTATISLGQGSVLLKFTGAKEFQLVLEGNGSLVLFERQAYELKHSIEEGCETEHADDTCRNASVGTAIRRDYRISITIRHMY